MSGEELTFSSRYKLDGKLGSGGMGAVYRAYDSVLKKHVAVKLLLPSQNQNMAIRFQQEAKAAAKLNHPNIIRVLDFGQTDKGECYLIMEYLKGKTLDEIVKVKPLDVASALAAFEQICLGMEHAHTHGVLHRDLKSSNVIVSDETAHVTIVDFGVAKLLSEDMHLTGKGAPIGSPTYMSPEQAQGLDLDVRSDLYSMGCLMYTVLLGKPPLMGETSLDTIKKQIEDAAPFLNDGFDPPRFSKELESIVKRALEKNPNDRFQNFSELRRAISALDEISSTPADTTAPSIVSQEQQQPNASLWRNPLIFIAISILVFTLSAVSMMNFGNVSTAQKKTVKVAPPTFFFKTQPGFLVTSPHWLVARGDLHKNGIKKLYAAKQLNNAIFEDSRIDDSDIAAIATLPLVALDLSGTQVTSAGLAPIASPQLKCLILNDNPRITDDSISDIRELGELQVLGLRGTSITDKGVKQLVAMKTLRCLDLENLPGVTSASLDYLKELPDLQCLKISGTAISTKNIDSLLKLSSLRYISFADSKLTDKDFDNLLKLKPLIINVSNSQITDKSLEKLLAINYPVFIEANNCAHITRDAVVKLRTQFPMDTRILNRIQSSFFKFTEGTGLPPGEQNLRGILDSLWYEPEKYKSKPAPGYQEFVGQFDRLRNFVGDDSQSSKKRSPVMSKEKSEMIKKFMDETFK